MNFLKSKKAERRKKMDLNFGITFAPHFLRIDVSLVNTSNSRRLQITFRKLDINSLMGDIRCFWQNGIKKLLTIEAQFNIYIFCSNFQRKWNIYARCRFFVPIFKENGIFMLGFLFSQFSPIEIIVFNKIFLYPIEDINFLSSNVKDILPPIIFCKVLRFKFAKLAMFWKKLCAL